MSCKRPLILQYRTNAKYLKNQNPDIENPHGTLTNIIYPSQKEFKGYEYYLSQPTIKRINHSTGEEEELGYKMIPCGKCLACQKQKRKEWATRIELEAKKYKHNYFITLTYDDEHLIIPEQSINTKTGQIFTNEENWREWKGTLYKPHVIRFLNSLRKWWERDYKWEGMKFYLSGEYGDIGERPHYHLICMNCPKLELIPIGENPKIKKPYYTNERIEKIWGKGYITIGEVNWDTISYTAGYVEKKLFGEVKDEVYAIKGQSPIFSYMSRNKGIGREWFEENKNKLLETDEIINSKGQSIKPPSYFNKLMDAGEPEAYKIIKEKREELAKNELKKKMSTTTKTIQDQLLSEEETLKHKQKEYEKTHRKTITKNYIMSNQTI